MKTFEDIKKHINEQDINIEILWIEYTTSKTLPKEIGNLKNLEYLNIINNKFINLPEEISELTNFKGLNFNNVKINEVDKSQIYYKITNENENHNGLQYKTGVIKDIIHWNDDEYDICTSGRMYFTTIKNIFNFYGGYGYNIRPIKLLTESKTIIEMSNNLEIYKKYLN